MEDATNPIEELRDEIRDPKNHLEVHGLAFRMNGFPIFASDDLGIIYDEDTDEPTQVGEVNEPAWDWDKDLTREDKEYFWSMVGAYVHGLHRYGDAKEKAYWTHPRIMRVIIEEYGIKCWHYPMHRLPKYAVVAPFECLVCESFIFPNRPLTREESAVFEARHVLTAQDYHL